MGERAPADDSAVDAIARMLLATWRRVDPRSNVALWPTSYIATFADMARAVRALMDAQVADARADERAKVYAEIDAHWASGADGG